MVRQYGLKETHIQMVQTLFTKLNQEIKPLSLLRKVWHKKSEGLKLGCMAKGIRT